MSDVKRFRANGSGAGRSSAQRVLSHLLTQSQPVSRPEIALACEVSRPTVFAAVERLTQLGLVTDVGQRVGLPGRSASLYEVSDQAGTGVGVDIGGSNIRVSLTDVRGRQLAETRQPTSATGGAAIAQQVVQLVRQLSDATRTEPGTSRVVGVSVPGVVDPDGATVHYAWNVGQAEPFDFRTPLREALQAEVLLDNNVNLAAVGEQWQGAAQQLQTFAVIAVGAGVGAGIVHAGQLLRGAHGAAGEVAFLPLSPDYRRRRAASPDEAGGLILLRKAQKQDGWPDGRPPTSVEELFRRAAGGEAPAVALVEEESRRIAAIAASICAIIDPETIILAGGVGANEALVARTRELVDQLAPFAPAVVRSTLGDRASLVGATALALGRAREKLVAGLGETNGAAASESLP
jgi:glucokinase